jgi:hypothetical protein
MTHPLREALFKLARESYARGENMLNSFSGSDQADSELYFCENRVYSGAGGQPTQALDEATPWDPTLANLEQLIAEQDKRWRDYAAGQAHKVAEAPKIKRGPSAGHSAISHRWVSPDAFTNRAHHIRTMVKILKEKHP